MNYQKHLYFIAKTIAIIYATWFCLMISAWMVRSSVYHSSTSQHYRVYGVNYDSFIEKADSLIHCNKDLAYYVTIDGITEKTETIYYIPYKPGVFEQQGYTVVSFYLKEFRTLANLFIKERTKPLLIELNLCGENLLSSENCNGIAYRERIYEHKTKKEIYRDIQICKSFEENVLSKICRYETSYPMTVFLWLVFFFELNFKYFLCHLVLIWTMFFIIRRFYVRYFRI